MARTPNRVSNVGFSSRLKQFIILIVIILLGMLISQSVKAQDYQRKNARHNKVKYKEQIKTQKHACVLLFKKWLNGPKSDKHVASRVPRYKPMAEMESPGNRQVVARKEEE